MNVSKIKHGQPLSFIENKGQIVAQNNEPRTDIQFRLSAPGINMFIGDGQLHYQFSRYEKKPEIKVTDYRMDVALLGANPNAEVIPQEKQAYYERYYSRQSGTNGIVAASYNRVTYKNVYHNIDWVIYTKNNHVEYDFVVHPGGHVKDIQLQYTGATAMSLNDNGTLSAATPLGKISEDKPVAYETKSRQPVSAKFVLNSNVLSFSTAACKSDLTIDPALIWGTYYGGTGDDEGSSVATDPQGNVYLAGTATSTTLATIGVAQATFGGGACDAYLVKFNAAGTRVWATYYGGTGGDSATSVACDTINGVYLAGYTNSNNAISGGATVYQAANAGGVDGYLVKFNPATGARIWGTYYGGTGDDYINAITTDHNGNVYIAGGTSSLDGIANGSGNQQTFGGTSDGFLAQFNSTGTLQWASYYGGSAVDDIYGISCDKQSNVFITGQTSSINAISTTGAHQTTLDGLNDAFIAKFTQTGISRWSTYYGGQGTDQGNGIVCDISGNVIVAGTTTSPDGIPNGTVVYQPIFNGLSDAFLVKLDSTGSPVFGTFYGGGDIDLGQSVCVDNFSNIYLTGSTYSTANISSAGSYQVANGGAEDAFYAKFDPYGQLFFGTYYGGTSYDIGNGIAVDTANNVYIGGTTSSANAIANVTGFQTTFGGGVSDGFLTKFARDTNAVINQRFTDTLLCKGSTFHVYYTTNYPFKTGNTFTVQLSDATGSFTAPISLGVLSATTSGVISCLMPTGATAPPGTGYRIRIKASNPAFTSPDDIYDIDIVNSLSSAPVASSNSPVCAGDTIKLNITASYIIDTIKWSGPSYTSTSTDGATAIIANATTANGGSYIAQNIHDGCPSQSDTINVAVNTVIPDITDSSNVPVCNGDSILLFAGSSFSPTTYSWTGPNSFTSTMQNPELNNISSVNGGWYYVVDTFGGCRSTKDSMLITVNNLIVPSISISVMPGDTLCYGTTADFTAAITNGGSAPLYQWLRSDNSIVGAIDSYYSAPEYGIDSIKCILMSSLACPTLLHDTSNLIVITVEPTVTPSVIINAYPGTLLGTGETAGFAAQVTNGGTNTTYQWFLNGDTVANATSPTYSAGFSQTGSDTISVVVFSNSPCALVDSAIASSVITIVPEGVANVGQAFSNVVLYPNPNNGAFTIKGALTGINSANVQYEITNVLGQIISRGVMPLQNSALNEDVSLGDIADGIYLLKISADGQSRIMRFSVQK